jgi:hypothetical protein
MRQNHEVATRGTRPMPRNPRPIRRNSRPATQNLRRLRNGTAVFPAKLMVFTHFQ